MKLAPKIVWLTFLGGALGSLSRWSLSEISDDMVSLWLVNLIGAFLVGIFNGLEYFKSDARRALWSAGFAGGFTTMSGIAVLVLSRNADAISLALMILSGLLCYFAAIKISSAVNVK